MSTPPVEFWWLLVIGTITILLLILAFVGSLLISNRRIKEERDFSSCIVDTNPALIIVLDDLWKIIRFNASFQAMTGYKEDKLRGSSIMEFIDFDKKITFRNGGIYSSETKEFLSQFEAGLKTKSDVQRVISWSVTELIESRQNARWLFTGIDITGRKRNEEKLLAYQEQLRSLASELSLTEERERRRIAEDLHDHIGQALALSKMKLAELQSMLYSANFKDQVSQILNLINQTILETRSLIFEISPPVLYDLGFVAALEWLVEKFNKDYNLSIHLNDDGLPKILTDELSVFLFKAVRELLINIIKHSRARNVTISLQSGGDEILIRVTDDGVGFDMLAQTSGEGNYKGFGLFNIRERLAYFGGYSKIESEPGKGTQVTLCAPLKKNGE